MAVDYDDLIKALDSIGEGVRRYPSTPFALMVTPSWFHSQSFKISFKSNNHYEKNGISLNENIVNDWDNYKSSEILENHAETVSSWYQPFHYLPREKWGIHLRYDSLISMSKFLIRKGCHDKYHAIGLSFLYFIIHETFHYAIESFTGNLEILLNNSDLYREYYMKVYKKSLKSKVCIEEELANIYLLLEWGHLGNDVSLLSDLREYSQIDVNCDFEFNAKNKRIRYIITQILAGERDPRETYPFDFLLKVRHYREYIHTDFPIWLHYESEVQYQDPIL
jgi:hypothetical protein